MVLSSVITYTEVVDAGGVNISRPTVHGEKMFEFSLLFIIAT